MSDAIKCDVCREFSDSWPRYNVQIEHQFHPAVRGTGGLDVCSATCLAELARRHDGLIADVTVDVEQIGRVRTDLRFAANSLFMVSETIEDDLYRGLVVDAIDRIEASSTRLVRLRPDPDDEAEDED